MNDLVIRNGYDYRRHRQARLHRRPRHRRRQDRQRRRQGWCEPSRNRRHRLADDAGVGRYPHPLRRPGGVGPVPVALPVGTASPRWSWVIAASASRPFGRGKEAFLISMMDGVEDIPTETLTAGIDFQWESFPEYLDALSRMKRVLDVGAHVPHCAVRAYVMGERGADNQPATADDIGRMTAVVREGVMAGALGVSTSRTLVHRTRDKAYVPGTFAAIDEMIGLGRGLGEAGRGVFEIISDITGDDANLEWMAQLSADTGRSISLAALISRRSAHGHARRAGIRPSQQRQRCAHGGASRRPSRRLADEPAKLRPSVQHPSQLSPVDGRPQP